MVSFLFDQRFRFKNFNDKSKLFFSLLNLSRRSDKNNIVFVDLQTLCKTKSAENPSFTVYINVCTGAGETVMV